MMLVVNNPPANTGNISEVGSIPGSGRSPGEGNGYPLQASLVALAVKNLPTMQETWVQLPGREDSLEKGMATLSSILAWRIPWKEEPNGVQSMGSQRVGSCGGGGAPRDSAGSGAMEEGLKNIHLIQAHFN